MVGCDQAQRNRNGTLNDVQQLADIQRGSAAARNRTMVFKVFQGKVRS